MIQTASSESPMRRAGPGGEGAAGEGAAGDGPGDDGGAGDGGAGDGGAGDGDRRSKGTGPATRLRRARHQRQSLTS